MDASYTLEKAFSILISFALCHPSSSVIDFEEGSPSGYSVSLYTGSPYQQFVADPQILSQSVEEPHILSLILLKT